MNRNLIYIISMLIFLLSHAISYSDYNLSYCCTACPDGCKLCTDLNVCKECTRSNAFFDIEKKKCISK